MKAILELCKIRLVYFVLLSGLAGYGLGYEIEMSFSWLKFLAFLFGLALVSMGSFALNQVQEISLDARMPRTKNRPVVIGKISKKMGIFYGLFFSGLGLLALWWVQEVSALLGLSTIVMYNLLYTLVWKPKWIFGAVPGAIPGAMPVVIGFSAASGKVFVTEAMYLFMILFLWQMPHFWALAMRFKEDYRKGGIPVLPAALGDERTLYHMGMYLFLYVALALASPWFVPSRYFYLLLVIPFAIKLLHVFYQYWEQKGKSYWLPFFLWVNFSMLAFVFAPVFDKWLFFWIQTFH